MDARDRHTARPESPSVWRAIGTWGTAAVLVAVLAWGCGSQPPTPTPSAAPTQTAAPTATPAPTPTPTPTPAATGAPSDSAATVATLVGEDAATVYLTDWNRIRGDRPVPADPAARFDLVAELADHAPASAFALPHFLGHREAWGWDSLDLAWEATVQGDGPPVFILALRPDADLDGILAHFKAREFAVDERLGAVLFSRPLSLADDWVTTTELAIHNTAILVEARLMVLSSSREAVDRALDALAGTPPAGGSPAAGTRASAFVAAVGALGAGDAAVVELRPDMCPTFAPRGDPDLGPVAARLHAWTALASGWRGGSSGATARLVFAYAEPGLATADLADRARLAREGSVGGRLLSETVFRLDDARAEGSLVVLDVSPAGGRPQGILSAFLRRDLVFAACG